MTEEDTSIAPPWADDPWFMEGTEGTGEYQVIGYNDAGRIGIRRFARGLIRVRIEPANITAAQKLADAFSPGNGWKQPCALYEREFRFSTVVGTDAAGIKVVLAAIKVLVRNGGKLTRSGKTRRWRSTFNGALASPLVRPPAGKQVHAALAAADVI